MNPIYRGKSTLENLDRRVFQNDNGTNPVGETQPKTEKTPLSYFNSGIVKYKSRDYEGAIEDFDKAIKLNPEISQIHSARGLCNCSMGNLEEAKKDYTRAIELESSNNQKNIYYLARAAVNVRLNLIDEADADYQNADKLKQEDSF